MLLNCSELLHDHLKEAEILSTFLATLGTKGLRDCPLSFGVRKDDKRVLIFTLVIPQQSRHILNYNCSFVRSTLLLDPIKARVFFKFIGAQPVTHEVKQLIVVCQDEQLTGFP